MQQYNADVLLRPLRRWYEIPFVIGFDCKRYPAVELFRKMRGLPEFPNEQKGAGDVISHLSEYDGKHYNVV